MAEADIPCNAVEFAKILRKDQARLYGYIHSLVRNVNDADDVFQQATLVMWKKFAEFDRSRSFFAWACGIARLEVANFLRTRERRRLYFSDELNLLLVEALEEMTSDEYEDRREALAGCVKKLQEHDRHLLMECYEDGTGVNVAAQRHGRSPQSVYNSLRRIRRALFNCVSRVLQRDANSGWAQ